MFPLQTKPYMLGSEEGFSLQSSGASIRVKANSEQTDGAFNLFDVVCPPGYVTPLHIHYSEDVAVYVLEGALTFFWGSEKRNAKSGSYFFQPSGTPHGFRVAGGRKARILYMTFPAGLDRLALEQGSLIPALESVTDAARYKIEILGPLPE